MLLWCVVLFGLASLNPEARAQGVSPDAMAGLTAIGVVTSGNGFFASIGAFRIALDRTGTGFSLVPLTTTVAPGAGSYTYTKTGTNTARIVLTDVVVRIGVPYVLTFTSQTSATYSATTGIGNQTGLLVLENGVLQSSASTAGFVNMSVRAVVPLNGQIIPGLVLDAPTRVLVRVAGPALAGFNVAGTLANPRLTVMAGNNALASNDDWSATITNQTAVQDAGEKTGAFAFTPGSRDAALVVDLAAGAYTCIISGDTGSDGEVLLEVYRVPR